MNDLTVLPYHIEFYIIKMKVKGYTDRHILAYTKQFNPEIVSCILERYRLGRYSEFAKKAEELIEKRREHDLVLWYSLGKQTQTLPKYDEDVTNYFFMMEACLSRFGMLSMALVKRVIDLEELNNGPGSYLLKHPTCYLNEARAMLEGKNCEGKNRCVKLPGD